MAKINFNNEDREFEDYGGKIKTRHKKKRQLKVKRPDTRSFKPKKSKRNLNKYEE